MYFPVIFLFNKWQDDAFLTSPWENKLIELDIKENARIRNGILERLWEMRPRIPRQCAIAA